jgi:hypothetical protein
MARNTAVFVIRDATGIRKLSVLMVVTIFPGERGLRSVLRRRRIEWRDASSIKSP